MPVLSTLINTATKPYIILGKYSKLSIEIKPLFVCTPGSIDLRSRLRVVHELGEDLPCLSDTPFGELQFSKISDRRASVIIGARYEFPVNIYLFNVTELYTLVNQTYEKCLTFLFDKMDDVSWAYSTESLLLRLRALALQAHEEGSAEPALSVDTLSVPKSEPLVGGESEPILMFNDK